MGFYSKSEERLVSPKKKGLDRMISAGIDIGGKDVKVLLLKNGQILAREKASGGFDQTAVVNELLEMAIRKAGIKKEDIEKTGVTVCGKKYAISHDEEITEIGAAEKGVPS
jgi:activator of 2-hydroxyglutaryl-CoA dehydratase